VQSMLVTVYDGAFARSSCNYLHTAASLGGLGDEQHTVFHRSVNVFTATIIVRPAWISR